MKKSGRIGFVLLFTAIYCFAMGVVVNSVTQNEVRNTFSSDEEICDSAHASNPFFHISQVESSVKNIQEVPVRSLKIKLTGLSLLTRVSEQLAGTKFSQYINSSRNFLVHYRKADMMFPFHSYW